MESRGGRPGLLSLLVSTTVSVDVKQHFNISFPKTIDLLCFPPSADVVIHLMSLFAARFKLCKLSFV